MRVRLEQDRDGLYSSLRVQSGVEVELNDLPT